MNPHAELCIDKVVQIEGGYTNNPDDSGGETIWGITVAVARAFGYSGAMRDMSRDQAKAIYKARFWDTLQLDDVAALSTAVAEELFDTGVNLGVSKAGEFLQQCLDVFNKQATLYPDVVVDGRVGAMTVAALREYIAIRKDQGVTVLLRALNALQGAFYINLATQRAKDETFVYGWLLNRVSI